MAFSIYACKHGTAKTSSLTRLERQTALRLYGSHFVLQSEWECFRIAVKMIAEHIHQALTQVHELQQKILEKQRFKGYSGRARALSGTLAFLAAIFLTFSTYPGTIPAHFALWSLVFVVSLTLNFGAMLYWFLFDPEAKRDLRRLKPLIDVFPPLLVGGLFTLVMVQHKHYSYLFGIWMSFFGLANLASRQVLPKHIWFLGIYYIVWGAVCLLLPVSFLNPWPMGLIFLFGEWAGGLILHFDENQNLPFSNFFKWKEDLSAQTE